MNNRNVERAAVGSPSRFPFPIFDVVIWAIAVALLVLLLAVSSCVPYAGPGYIVAALVKHTSVLAGRTSIDRA
jgi:hypothetical protein